MATSRRLALMIVVNIVVSSLIVVEGVVIRTINATIVVVWVIMSRDHFITAAHIVITAVLLNGDHAQISFWHHCVMMNDWSTAMASQMRSTTARVRVHVTDLDLVAELGWFVSRVAAHDLTIGGQVGVNDAAAWLCLNVDGLTFAVFAVAATVAQIKEPSQTAEQEK